MKERQVGFSVPSSRTCVPDTCKQQLGKSVVRPNSACVHDGNLTVGQYHPDGHLRRRSCCARPLRS